MQISIYDNDISHFLCYIQWMIRPLSDNQPSDVYYYKINVYTGLRSNAGTKSTICFILSGKRTDSGLRILNDGKKNVRTVTKGELG